MTGLKKKLAAGIHLKNLHGKNAYSRPNNECRIIIIMLLC